MSIDVHRALLRSSHSTQEEGDKGMRELKMFLVATVFAVALGCDGDGDGDGETLEATAVTEEDTTADETEEDRSEVILEGSVPDFGEFGREFNSLPAWEEPGTLSARVEWDGDAPQLECYFHDFDYDPTIGEGGPSPLTLTADVPAADSWRFDILNNSGVPAGNVTYRVTYTPD
jgi:hypothetical protein